MKGEEGEPEAARLGLRGGALLRLLAVCTPRTGLRPRGLVGGGSPVVVGLGLGTLLRGNSEGFVAAELDVLVVELGSLPADELIGELALVDGGREDFLETVLVFFGERPDLEIADA